MPGAGRSFEATRARRCYFRGSSPVGELRYREHRFGCRGWKEIRRRRKNPSAFRTQSTTATPPIEMSNPFGSGTCMTIRAGGSSGKYSAKRRLSSGKLEISVTRTVVLRTSLSWLPPASSTVSRFRKTCRACDSKLSPAASPVAGSSGLTRDKQQVSGAHSLGVRAYRFDVWNLNDLLLCHV